MDLGRALQCEEDDLDLGQIDYGLALRYQTQIAIRQDRAPTQRSTALGKNAYNFP